MGLPHDSEAVAKMIDAVEMALAVKEASDDYPYYLLENEFEALANHVFTRQRTVVSHG